MKKASSDRCCPSRIRSARWAPIVAIVANGLAVGCTAELDVREEAVEPILDAVAVVDEGVIVGELDWRNASTLPAGTLRTAANAAAYLSIPEASSRCSAFLISRDVLMTNHHCVGSAAEAKNVVANFRYETSWDQSGVVRCDEFIGANQALDYALLRCQGAPGDTYGFLDLDGRDLPTNTPITLLHQNCDYFTTPTCTPTKKVSPGKITGATTNRILHDADMLGGSSGGAIIAEGTTTVVAINNAHVVNTTNGRGTINLGVPMSLIVPDLRANHPELFGSCEPIAAAGRTLDEDDDCTTLGGQPRYLRAVSGAGFDGDLVWTGTTASSTSGNFGQWQLPMAQAGRYELSVWIDTTYGTAARARYLITHAGRTDAVVINQGAVSSSGFVSLGTFDFAAGEGQSVRLNDNTGDRAQQLVIDALRVRPAATPPPPSSPEPTETCSAVMVVNATSLNVRATPDTSRSPIGTLSGGEVVRRVDTVRGQSVSGDTTWHLVEKTGLRGYISARYAACQ